VVFEFGQIAVVAIRRTVYDPGVLVLGEITPVLALMVNPAGVAE